jgi:hypothetical protein
MIRSNPFTGYYLAQNYDDIGVNIILSECQKFILLIDRYTSIYRRCEKLTNEQIKFHLTYEQTTNETDFSTIKSNLQTFIRLSQYPLKRLKESVRQSRVGQQETM